MVTASSVTGSASAGRPSAENQMPRLASDGGEVGAVAVRAGGGQLPADGDGFLGDRQRVGRAAQLGEPDAEVGQGSGEVGAVAVRAGGGQLPADGDGFLGDRQRVGRAAQLGEPDAEVGQGWRRGRGGSGPGWRRPAPGGW